MYRNKIILNIAIEYQFFHNYGHIRYIRIDKDYYQKITNTAYNHIDTINISTEYILHFQPTITNIKALQLNYDNDLRNFMKLYSEDFKTVREILNIDKAQFEVKHEIMSIEDIKKKHNII